jgi:DNA-directed RNA polymerase subunit beta'
MSVANKVIAKYDGVLEIDELRAVPYVTSDGETYDVVIGRSAEMKIVDKNTGIVLTSGNIPYGAHLYFKSGTEIKKKDLICDWDPFNAVIISEFSGSVSYENIIEGQTYRVESDEQTGFHDKVIIETRQKAKNPNIKILGSDGSVIKAYDIPVGSHITVEEKDKIKAGDILVKIPRAIGKTGDITGGLPRVTELFEARNPSDPAVVAEIDGVVSFGKKLKRGNREVIITSKTGEEKKYLIPTSKQILAQENDYVRAGTSLSEGAMTPSDILSIKGPMKVQEYIVNEVQEVYRLQGVKINDKHFEVIVRQMMRKVEVMDPGDTKFLEGELVNKIDFMDENDWIFGKKVVLDAGESETFTEGQIVSARNLREENSLLKRRDKKLVESREAQPATAKQILQGITRASLQTKSFISAASFQETTKVLTNASIQAKSDSLLGLKENVIVGHLIPAGTGLRQYKDIVVGSKEEYEQIMASKSEFEEAQEVE